MRKTTLVAKQPPREPVFMMQAAEYGSLHHPVSDGQTVSVRGGPRTPTWAQTDRVRALNAVSHGYRAWSTHEKILRR